MLRGVTSTKTLTGQFKDTGIIKAAVDHESDFSFIINRLDASTRKINNGNGFVKDCVGVFPILPA